jgi:catechol 2,3-dioxygenase-like lactoylglutathione lyase family enzyme
MPITRPKHAMPESANKGSWLIKKKWFRELILLPVTLSGKRRYNKTEDYGVFRDNTCIISHLEQCSYYVTDIQESRAWFEQMGFTHARTCAPEPHPDHKGHTLTCCYMNAQQHEECLVLMEHRDINGKIIAPTIKDAMHVAYELSGNRLQDTFNYEQEMNAKGVTQYYGPAKHNNSKPHGDGESGGNVAIYFYTPDYHHIEFCADMDTVDNYEGRYGTGVRTTENDQYL